MQGMKGHEMWAVVHRHCAAELLVHDASRGNLDGWCAYTCMALIAIYWRGSARCPRRSLWSQLWDSERLLSAENRTLPEQTHVSLPSVHSPLLHDLERKVSSSTSWTCLGQLLRQCSTTPLSLRRNFHEIFVNQDEQRVLLTIVWTSIAVRLVKHDPWSSPASDVTMHDVVLRTLLLLLFAGIIFCEFLRFGKNRKIKYPQKFLPTYQAPWFIYNHKLRDDYPFWIMHNLSLLIVSAFSFLPSGAITSSKKWRLMLSMIVGVSRVNFVLRFTGPSNDGCTVHHVECCYMKTTMYLLLHVLDCNNFSLDTPTLLSQSSQSWAFTFGCAKSQNLARFHEIAKISTRKIVTFPKSQNFVLANNSNNKVAPIGTDRRDDRARGGEPLARPRAVYGRSWLEQCLTDASFFFFFLSTTVYFDRVFLFFFFFFFSDGRSGRSGVMPAPNRGCEHTQVRCVFEVDTLGRWTYSLTSCTCTLCGSARILLECR